jgi:phospholipase A1
MRSYRLLVCAGTALLSAACAPMQPVPQCIAPVAVAGPVPATGAPGTPVSAPAADVAVTGTTPAPVTAPGAPAVDNAPVQQTAATPEAPAVPETNIDPIAPVRRAGLFQADPDAYEIVSAGRGLSLHKPMFVLPYTYSPDYDGRHTEVLFDISFKQRLFGIPLYAAYSQKSFWQAYDFHESSPFRETDYNPELFYRYIPADRARWFHLGADVGFEHESNGKGLPDSRSWNRFYAAIFQAEDNHLIYWKWWYRLPADDNLAPTNPERDDNPHIGYYYGYSELTYEQQLFGKQLARAMFRFNPVTGKGAINLQYTVPNKASNPDFFWMVYLWQGYGEDLLNYNRSTFRIGVGLSLAR